MESGMDAKLSLGQALKVTALGLLVWFVGALAVRIGRPLGLFEAYLPLVYAATVPIMFVTVWAIRRLAGLSDAQYPAGIALGTAAAIACDGLIIAFSPALYGGPGPDLAVGAAWILWAGAVGFVPPLLALSRSR